MIDQQRFDSLKSEIGIEGMALLSGIFLDEADQIIDKLKAKTTDLASGLHALHGSALNLGLKQLAFLCARAEKAAHDGGDQSVNLSEISATYFQSRAAFMDALQQS